MYKRVPTSAEVFAVIRARHPELRVFDSYSATEGDEFGDPSKGKMFTSFGFDGGKFPIIEAETTWDIEVETRERINETHRYWLIVIPINNVLTLQARNSASLNHGDKQYDHSRAFRRQRR